MDTYPWRLAAAGLSAVVIGLVIFGLLAAMPAGFETIAAVGRFAGLATAFAWFFVVAGGLMAIAGGVVIKKNLP